MGVYGFMKKWLIALIGALSLAFFAAGALADGPVNPYRPDMERDLRLLQEALSSGGLVTAAGAPTVTVSGPSSFSMDKTPLFRASISGGQSGVSYTVGFGIVDEGRDAGYIYYAEPTADFNFTCVPIYNAGSYILWARLCAADDPDTVLSYGYMRFTVTGDSGVLDRKARQIVDQCRAEDDWHTALNLHDWLTSNIYYDLNYHYYGEDCIIRGFGVCDSYSKAYRLLLQTAGIQAGRVTNQGHAWNILRLDGAWYQVDPTWDDPAGLAVALSGQEHHAYFCLNEELMYLDHGGPYDFEPTWYEGNACTSLEANYHIHEGLWTDFLMDYSGYWSDGEYVYYLVDRRDQIISAFDGGSAAVTLQGWDSYWTFNQQGKITGAWVDDKTRVLLVYGMDRSPLTLSDGSSVHLSVSYDAAGDMYYFAVTGWAMDEAGTLTLDAGAREIGAEAFMDTAATTLVIPPLTESIGPRAFAYSALRTVFVQGAGLQVDPTAFEGCDRLIIHAPSNSARPDWAREGDIVLFDQ